MTLHGDLKKTMNFLALGTGSEQHRPGQKRYYKCRKTEKLFKAFQKYFCMSIP